MKKKKFSMTLTNPGIHAALTLQWARILQYKLITWCRRFHIVTIQAHIHTALTLTLIWLQLHGETTTNTRDNRERKSSRRL
jgi:hypothetical protein